MNLTLTILLMIGAWLTVAAAMLWGVLRIARRHHAARPRSLAMPKPAPQQQGPASV